MRKIQCSRGYLLIVLLLILAVSGCGGGSKKNGVMAIPVVALAVGEPVTQI
jgi:hypothetical protein